MLIAFSHKVVYVSHHLFRCNSLTIRVYTFFSSSPFYVLFLKLCCLFAILSFELRILNFEVLVSICLINSVFSSSAYDTLKCLGLPEDSVALLSNLTTNICEQCVKEILETTHRSKSFSFYSY